MSLQFCITTDVLTINDDLRNRCSSWKQVFKDVSVASLVDVKVGGGDVVVFAEL